MGLLRLKGPRELVALVGVGHGFDVTSAPDIFTWTLTFLDAEVRGNTAARAKLQQMGSVAGGGDDHVVIPLESPGAINYSGLWWNAPAGSESGWGMNLTHQDDLIFTTWFTYDANGKGWWLVMTAQRRVDGTYRGTLYSTRGPPFSATPVDPGAVVRTEVGAGTLSLPMPTTARSPIRSTESRKRKRYARDLRPRPDARSPHPSFRAGDQLSGPLVGGPPGSNPDGA